MTNDASRRQRLPMMVGLAALTLFSLYAVRVLADFGWDPAMFVAFGEDATPTLLYGEEKLGREVVTRPATATMIPPCTRCSCICFVVPRARSRISMADLTAERRSSGRSFGSAWSNTSSPADAARNVS